VVKNIISEPYFELYQKYITDFDLKSEREHRWAKRLARNKHHLDTSSGFKKEIYKGVKWTFATVLAGQFNDDLASKIEKITEIPKKYSQDWNVLWSSIPHIVFVSGGINTVMNSSNYNDFVSEVGIDSLYVSVPMAVFNLGWNIYRLANRDDKARPALGYEGLIANGLMYLGSNYYKIKDSVRFFYNANHPGALKSYTLDDLPFYDLNDSLIIEDKLLITSKIINEAPTKLEKIVNGRTSS